jgi:hypothetical protein
MSYDSPLTATKSTALAVQQPGVLSNNVTSAALRRLKGSNAPLNRVAKPGLEWLKMAFAAPDFPVLSPMGIPDDYTGRTLPKTFRQITSITIPSNDFTIIIPPIPGYAYGTFDGPVVAASDIGLVDYTDMSSIFGNSALTTADQVTAFRYMSQLAELVPTTNATSWSGSISCYKVPMKLASVQVVNAIATIPPVNINSTIYTVTGGQGISSTAQDQYTAPSNLGVFAAATSDNVNFPFTDVREGVPSYNTTARTGGTAVPGTFASFTPPVNRFLPGWGELDTIVFRVQGAVDNTFVLKTWAALEFQVLSSSALYQYTHISPSKDLAALQCYSAFVRACPIAVSYYENASFWQTLLGIATTVSGALSHIPGPWGALSGGVNQVLQSFKPKGKRTQPKPQTLPTRRGQMAILPYPMPQKSRKRR